MRHLQQDLRYAWRQLRHAPGFTIVAVVTLGLGIGANTAFFSIVNALAFKDSPGVNLDRVHAPMFVEARTGQPAVGLQRSDLTSMQARMPTGVAEITGVHDVSPQLIQIPGHAQSVLAERVGASFSRVLDLPPQVGQWISADDERSGASSVVISDRIWREWFAANRDAVGRPSIKINRKPFTIVGVAPAGFDGVRPLYGQVDLWLPLFPIERDLYEFQRRSGLVLVKALPGVGRAQLERELTGLVATPPARAGQTPVRLAVAPAAQVLRPRGLTMVNWAILALSSLILVAACANLANMLYARGARRAGEVAVRLSLGGTRARVLRLFLAETAIIAGLSAAVGFAFALGATELFTRAFPALNIDRVRRVTLDLSPDYRVFLFALGAGTAAAIVVGLMTAWRSSRVPLLSTLAASGAPGGLTARKGLRTSLVAVQVTVAVLLVMGTGLFFEQTRKDLFRRVHFDTASVTTARVSVSTGDPGYSATRGRVFFERLVQDVVKRPGVEAAALAHTIPGGVGQAAPRWTVLLREDPPRGASGATPRIQTWFAHVSPRFFDAVGLPILRGRDFMLSDVDGGPPVAIVSQIAADALWPGEDPIGKRAHFAAREWVTVVGVSADPLSSWDNSPANRVANFLFRPWAQNYTSNTLIVARSANATGQIEALRSAVRAIDEDVAVFDASTLDQSILAWAAPLRAAALLMNSLGVLALGIAMLGVYGVIAYFVSTRTREFGIRMALGATPGRVLKMVIDQAIHVVLVGLLSGVFLASVGSRWIESWQFDIMPNEISTWVVVPLLILAAGVLAGYLPARRAAKIDPNVALREL